MIQDIEEGDEITMQHLSSILGTHKRRRRIMSDFYLDCECRRCSDPTECGTFVSGVTCEACEAGVMLPIDPLDVYSDWACSDCDFVLSFDVIGKSDCVTKLTSHTESVKQVFN